MLYTVQLCCTDPEFTFITTKENIKLMVYLFNTNLDNKKKVKIALQSIHGIGQNLAQYICDQNGITDIVRMNQLSNKQLENLATFIGQHIIIGAELKQQKRQNKSRLIKIASYKGFRYTEGLPCRGQRTHSNARTCRKTK